MVANFKLLCFSEAFDNILMWARYSQNHTGVVLELSCNEKLDSAWGAARPVKYMDRMPLLVDEERLVRLMSGEGEIGEGAEILRKSIFGQSCGLGLTRKNGGSLEVPRPNQEDGRPPVVPRRDHSRAIRRSLAVACGRCVSLRGILGRADRTMNR